MTGEEDLKPHPTLLVLVLLLLPTLLLLKKLVSHHAHNRSNPHPLRLPPGPLSLPVIGHLHLLGPIPHQSLHRLSQRHGPLIHLRLGSVPCVVASTASMAREFLRTHGVAFSDRPSSKAIAYLTYGSADFSFAPYGPYWKFMKKLCMSDLLGGRILEQLLPLRREEVRGLIGRIKEKADRKEEVDMGKELIRMTNNVVSRMAMGRRCSGTEEGAEEARRVVEDMAELTGRFNLADFVWALRDWDVQGFGRRLEDVHGRFDRMMEGILKEKEEERKKKKKKKGKEESEGGVKDLLDVLLDVYEDEKAEMRLSRENIKAFILDIFAAGTDTSAITTEWALAELVNHPTVLAKARAELDSTVDSTSLVSEPDVPNLPYLQAIVKETLRLHPTGPLILRESTADCVVSSYDIPARTRLFVNAWAIGRDPDNWPEPLEFRPERFLEGSAKNMDVRGQHFELLPFGSGRRGCPGTSLAMAVVQAALGAMVQCFEWEVEGGVVDMEEGRGLTLPRAKPLVLTPVARFDPLPLE